MNMNILFLSPENPYPPQGGHHLRSYNVLRLLAQDHRIFFVGFSQGNADFYYIPQLGKLCETVDIFRVPRTGYNLPFLREAVKNLFQPHPLIAERYLLKAARQRIRELMERCAIDLVHIDMLACALYRDGMEGVPVLVTNHNVESLRLQRRCQVTANPFLRSYLLYQSRKLYRFEREMCSRFDCCITVSAADRDYLQQMSGASRFAVIPNGVDTGYFRPVEGEETTGRLVWVGGMATAYNADAVDFFIGQIWPLITRLVPGVTIDFIGHSPTAKLRQTAAIDPRVRLFGFVDDVRPLVQSAALFIAPIRSGSGTKIKVLNAMAQAKAVVGTTVAAEGIEARDGFHLCIADEPGLFAERVAGLLADPSRREQMGRAAQHLIEQKYSWDVIDMQMKRLYGQFETKA